MNVIESTIRNKLVISHHIIQHNNLDDLLSTHLSARIPDTNQILITPLDVPFEKIQPHMLVKLDLNGDIIDDNGYSVMPQGSNIHLPIYQNNPNIHSAMHTHSIYGTAVSSLECGLLFMNQHALRFYDEIAYHNYDALALGNEGEQIANSLKDKKVMVLRNHGLLTTGTSIEQATYLLFYLERACEIQIKTLSTNQTIIKISPDICLKTKAQFMKITNPKEEFWALANRCPQSINYAQYNDETVHFSNNKVTQNP
ncbi:class II aldolase/adducin family protein [Thiotrichales bacterium 19S3-7]|nr:class II aldolase/adducin family protein [Thiotrichales bacterium 19S3-7]MCF6800993.1 class II aldolase/adducin family protein [Thiotrichales bacterium 19S3-11]